MDKRWQIKLPHTATIEAKALSMGVTLIQNAGTLRGRRRGRRETLSILATSTRRDTAPNSTL